ncbi:pyridoxine 5'-phosphate synthase [Limisalsivibrio acetivorans]|uniref:pyridoxine 5'-phosphate synthase n=1 Tax=Limisalsivibrio acetivorans TaxID=1304888 RepID=UPI0003B5917F|nr:pyridoxine 5'-phosphate synthase [Limisalsivibrio acetivorans]
MIKLGINIDHVATVREARKGHEPDPVQAALLAELGGADGITVHLREDRRHINERDVRLLRDTINTRLNLEMACSDEIIDIAFDVLPDACTLVPEKRQELTTEGGLDVVSNFDTVTYTVRRLMERGIDVSIFIDPDEEQIAAAFKTGAKYIELHTGRYADTKGFERRDELTKLTTATEFAMNTGFIVNAGHGLDYWNVQDVVSIRGMHEVNIGHSIISRAVFTGLERAVRDMRNVIDRAAHHAGV